MLIDFRVENHRSLRDEQVLTLEAGRIGEGDDARVREVSGHDQKLLPAAVIYGANASGKSNVLSAFSFMRDAVVYSHRLWDPDSDIPRTPFAWGGNRDKPSLFEVAFVVDDVKYAYGFVVSDLIVEEEWLFVWPNNRKQTWFERDGEQFKFGEHLKGPNEVIREVTRPNALFASVASQHQHKQLSLVYSWFREIASLNVSGHRQPLMSTKLAFSPRTPQRFLFSDLQPDEEAAEQIRQLLRTSDTGIVDVRIVTDEDEQSKRTFRRHRILLQHHAGDDNSWLDLEEESQGTQTLFRMASPIFRVLASGGLLLIDEIESSLHPLLGLQIVKMFNNPKSNPKNAQIIFTTHDTNLLGTTLGDPPLRRDQIWFTEKDADGASRLYPLTDFKPRKAENLERGYLQGRYGAIPFLGDIKWAE